MKVRLRDRTGAREYRYVVEDVDRHGNVRVYFRRKGQPKLRLIETPGTAAFEDEYRRAHSGELTPAPRSTARHAPATPGTMRWLCERYYASAAFSQLDADSTRIVRRRILDSICERAGHFRYPQMRPLDVAKLRDEKAPTPEAANSLVKALRQLFGWATLPEYQYADKNPAKEVAYLKSNNPEGHRIWSEGDVAKFEARHLIGTKARLALDLFLFTGARISDVARLGPQMERDGKLVFSEFKGRNRTKKTHVLPILPPLRASIDATPTGHLVYIATQHGHPHSVKGFGNWFARQCQMAGLDKGLSPHGLRKTGAVRCVEAGATEHQLMALFGWTTTKQAALYTRKANRARLEAEAAPLLQGHKPNESVPLFPVVASGGTIRGKRP